MRAEITPSDRAKVNRGAHRARYDQRTVYSIIDSALVAAVAIIRDGEPYVQPMLVARDGDDVILHGSARSGLLRAAAAGARLCMNVTHLDGIVFARRLQDHTAHYRSVTVHGVAREVGTRGEKRAAMDVVVTHLLRSNRAESLVPVTDAYVDGTMVLRLPLSDCSAKVNDAPTEKDGTAGGIWSGILPLRQTAGEPAPDRQTLGEGLGVPEHVSRWGCRV